MRRIGDVMRWRRLVITAAIAGAALVTQIGPGPAGASTLPTGFRDSVVLSGLTNPTVLQFAPDGRIFVGQKNGVIKVFQSLADTNPVTVADLSREVDDYWDRGLLGMALAGLTKGRFSLGHEPRSVQRELMLGHQARAAEGTAAT